MDTTEFPLFKKLTPQCKFVFRFKNNFFKESCSMYWDWFHTKKKNVTLYQLDISMCMSYCCNSWELILEMQNYKLEERVKSLS